MSFRSGEVYVQRKTLRRLIWLATLHKVTSDEYADKLLNEVIEERFPQILEAEASLKDAEKKFLASLEGVELKP